MACTIRRVSRVVSLVGATMVALGGGAAAAQPAPPGTPAPVDDAVARSRLREDAIEILMQGVRSERAEQRANACEALLLLPSRLASVAGDLLADHNPAVRAVAAMAVGRAKLPGFASQLRVLASDSDAMVSTSAMFALSRLGENVDLTSYAHLLTTDPDPKLRAHVAFLLGELGNPSAIGLLRDAARREVPRAYPAEDRAMRLQIAEALLKLGDEAAVHELRAALYPSRPEELEGTALAAQIMGEVDDRGSIDQLVVLTAWKEREEGMMPPEVRLAAAGSLAQLGMPQGSFIAEEYASSKLAPQRAQAAFVLGQSRQATALPVLGTLMADPEPAVRLAAAAAVVRVLEPEAAGARGTRRR